jgi:hypothetical protein
VIRSPDELARAPCFSGSCASLIMGFTCGTFDLELREHDVADCIYDKTQMSAQEFIYMGGLSLNLGMKGETVNEAKYSIGSRREA